MNKPIIAIRNLTKRFGPVAAVDDVSFDIAPNEFFALLGPSGCGKTTLLRMLAGLETPTSGEIVIDGQDMAQTPPNRRPVNMVFQSYAVFPHMSVRDNVEYGLKVVGTPREETRRRAVEALAMVKLELLAERKPDQLSGGQRQRVALARALVKRPKVLLLDEPLSALDAKLREQMQLELTRLQQTVGITFIIVTHDQDEALSMANRIAVMDAGKVSQIASPTDLYEHPANRFVADFIGKVNLIAARVKGARGKSVIYMAKGVGQIELAADHEAKGDVMLAVRPEKLKLTAKEPTAKNLIALSGRVRDVAYYGDTSHVVVTAKDGIELSVNIQNERRRGGNAVAQGQEIWVSWAPEDTLVLTE
ncbi:MAG: ABC transporter ATP-binding protein [Pseudomonadota bacterium]|nr:ABC transporter ATP-binding protein [Pseudomonadota bacterium]